MLPVANPNFVVLANTLGMFLLAILVFGAYHVSETKIKNSWWVLLFFLWAISLCLLLGEIVHITREDLFSPILVLILALCHLVRCATVPVGDSPIYPIRPRVTVIRWVFLDATLVLVALLVIL